MANNTLRAQDTISGALGSCFITMYMDREGKKTDTKQRYRFGQVSKLDADIELTKASFIPLGQTEEVNKITGSKGKGSATFKFDTAMFLKMYNYFRETGQEMFFDMQVNNEDKASTAKSQTVTLKNCLLDTIPIARLDTSAATLEANISFTYEYAAEGSNTFEQIREGWF
jgi:hypothetical protein